MGMEYKLIKVKTKEVYDLDKGSWCGVFPQRQLFKMYNQICPWGYGDNMGIRDGLSDIDASIKELGGFYGEDKYRNELIKDILSWCGDDYIIMDDDNGPVYEEWEVSPYYKKYKETGNRFMKNEYLGEGVPPRYLKENNT